MIEPDHHCAWITDQRSQLTWDGEHVTAAGVPRAVIHAVASRVGYPLAEEPDPNDEYGTLLRFGPWHCTVHDDCFVQFDSADEPLRNAFLQAIIELHDYYLQSAIGPAGVGLVAAHLRPDVTVELQSDARRCEFAVKSYPIAASWWERRSAPVKRIVIPVHRS